MPRFSSDNSESRRNMAKFYELGLKRDKPIRFTATAYISGMRRFDNTGHLRAVVKHACTTQNKIFLGDHQHITGADNADILADWDELIANCPADHMVKVTFSSIVGLYSHKHDYRFADMCPVSAEYVKCANHPKIYADVKYSRQRLADNNNKTRGNTWYW